MDLPQSAAPPVFEAVIVPHRSLSPYGLRWLVGVICVLSFGISTGLWFIGAWPVIAFNGAEVGLALVLLRRNALAVRGCEMLLLSDDGVRVVRTDAAGRRVERRLQSAWLRAQFEERPGRNPALWLSDRGGRMEVGVDLGEAEKRDLAVALRAALYRQRHPVFDNPQLRKG